MVFFAGKKNSKKLSTEKQRAPTPLSSATLTPKITGCLTNEVPPPPCISYANVHNYDGPYAYCGLAVNSGKFSDRSPPTDLCPLIQCIVTGTAAKQPPQFTHEYGAGGAATVQLGQGRGLRTTHTTADTHVRRPHVLKLAIQDLWDASD